MPIILSHIKIIMLLSGGITCTMALALFAPELALKLTFGDSISGPIAEIVTRNWGALIAITGGMLIYGALNEDYRRFVLVIASVSKIIFITLVVSIGAQYLGTAFLAVVFDSIVVLLFILYLINNR